MAGLLGQQHYGLLGAPMSQGLLGRDPMNPYAPPAGGETYWSPEQGQTTTDRVAGAVAMMPYGMAGAAWDAVTAPGRAYQEGMTQDEMIRSSADLAGMVTTGGVGAPAVSGGLGMGMRSNPGIKAYHGSPHDFDKFSMEKIGTGEGAQAYGRGLYFAENERVAHDYRKALGGKGQIDGINARLSELAAIMQKDAIPGSYRKYRSEAGEAAAQEYDDLLEKRSNLGTTYEVSIDASPDEFLDWDKPLIEQSPKVREIMDQIGTAQKNRPLDPADMGKDVYYKQTQGLTNDSAAERLRSAGIKGIRYKDAGSRHGQGGTSNYVVFSDEIITILKKYGIAGLIAAGMGEEVAKGIAKQYGMEGEVY